VLDSLADAQTKSSQHIVELAQGVKALQAQVDELRHQVQDLDQRFTSILAERHQQVLPEAPTSGLHDQIMLSEELATLFLDIDQGFRELYSEAHGNQPLLRHRADWLAAFTKFMFGNGAEPDVKWHFGVAHSEPLRAALRPYLSRGYALVLKAKSLGEDHAFVFDFDGPGAAIDHQTQEAWAPCDPEGPVESLVTPGYRVGSRTHLRQRLYTRGDYGR